MPPLLRGGRGEGERVLVKDLGTLRPLRAARGRERERERTGRSDSSTLRTAPSN